MTPDLKSVLGVFRTPSSTATAAQRFGCPEAVLEGLLLQLQARGMLSPAEPGAGACSSGCGMCSLQNFCPSSESEAVKEPTLTVRKARVWRLTPLGEQSIHRLT